MHRNYHRANLISKQVIGAAIEVHRFVGPGLMESIYEKCMMRELELRKLSFKSQTRIPLRYKGIAFEEYLKLDIYVEDCLIVELKTLETVLPVHKAQLLSYMKLLDAPIGLLINFHTTLLRNGISRLLLNGANLAQ